MKTIPILIALAFLVPAFDASAVEKSTARETYERRLAKQRELAEKQRQQNMKKWQEAQQKQLEKQAEIKARKTLRDTVLERKAAGQTLPYIQCQPQNLKYEPFVPRIIYTGPRAMVLPRGTSLKALAMNRRPEPHPDRIALKLSMANLTPSIAYSYKLNIVFKDAFGDVLCTSEVKVSQRIEPWQMVDSVYAYIEDFDQVDKLRPDVQDSSVTAHVVVKEVLWNNDAVTPNYPEKKKENPPEE